MAKGIYQAFVKYKDKYNKGFTVPYSSPKDNSINIPSIVPDDDNDEKEKPQTRKQTRRRTETPRPRVEEQPKEKADSDSKEKHKRLPTNLWISLCLRCRYWQAAVCCVPAAASLKGLRM